VDHRAGLNASVKKKCLLPCPELNVIQHVVKPPKYMSYGMRQLRVAAETEIHNCMVYNTELF
jgi:hypothetical protein